MEKRVHYHKITRPVIFLFIACLAALAMTGPLSSCKKEEKIIPAETVKMMAADFSLRSLSGDTIRLSDQRDKVVVLFFFGFGCPHCKESAPRIQESLVAPYVSRTDYLLVGLDVWNGSPSAVESFRNTTGLSVPMLLNASGVGTVYGTTNDRLIVVDKAGYVRFKGNQAAYKDLEAAKQVVNELIIL